MLQQRTPDCQELLARMLARTYREGDCIVWTGAKISKGYGTLRVPVIFGAPIGGKVWKTHRLVYYLVHGYVENHVLHKCDNPPCINIDHLFLGTDLDNKRDSIAKGRHARGETHAKAKLTLEEVAFIRTYFNGPKPPYGSVKILANRYGVVPSAIRAIRDGIHWKDS